MRRSQSCQQKDGFGFGILCFELLVAGYALRVFPTDPEPNRPLRSRRKVRKGRPFGESGAGLVKENHFPKPDYDSPKSSTLRAAIFTLK